MYSAKANQSCECYRGQTIIVLGLNSCTVFLLWEWNGKYAMEHGIIYN